jgi:hypothetical protein
VPRNTAKRKATPESYRWPLAFAKSEICHVGVDGDFWKLVEADLSKLHRELSHQVVHEVPHTLEQLAQQNFQRGVISGIERILEFREELKDWRETHK